MYCIFKLFWRSFKQLPVIQFWELMSKNEIWRTISCIYFMKIWVDLCFVTSEVSLMYHFSNTEVLRVNKLSYMLYATRCMMSRQSQQDKCCKNCVILFSFTLRLGEKKCTPPVFSENSRKKTIVAKFTRTILYYLYREIKWVHLWYP